MTWRVVIFLLALAGFAIAFAPASLVARQREGALSYARSHGTIWNGRLEEVQIGPFATQVLSWRLSFTDLVQGKAVVPVTVSGGDLEGVATMSMNWRNDRRLAIPEMRIIGAPLGAGVRAQGVTIVRDFDVFFDDGRCARAAGAVETDVLTHTQEAVGWAGPRLVGDVACEGDDARVVLAGGDAEDAVQVRIDLSGDGAGRWRASTRTDNPEAQATLATLGFAAEGGEMSKSETMRWLPF